MCRFLYIIWQQKLHILWLFLLLLSDIVRDPFFRLVDEPRPYDRREIFRRSYVCSLLGFRAFINETLSGFLGFLLFHVNFVFRPKRCFIRTPPPAPTHNTANLSFILVSYLDICSFKSFFLALGWTHSSDVVFTKVGRMDWAAHSVSFPRTRIHVPLEHIRFRTF